MTAENMILKSKLMNQQQQSRTNQEGDVEVLDTSNPVGAHHHQHQHSKFEEEKVQGSRSHEKQLSNERKKKKDKYEMEDDEEELVNEIDNFLIEDGDL